MYHTLYRSLYHRILADRACEAGHKSLRPILGCSACVDAEVFARSPSVAIYLQRPTFATSDRVCVRLHIHAQVATSVEARPANVG